jgi:hypothetical protein
MTHLEDALAEIEELVRTVRLNDAESRIRAVLESLSPEELIEWEFDLRQTIGKFLPKRRRALLAELSKGLARDALTEPDSPATDTGQPLSTQAEEVDTRELLDDFTTELKKLSDNHIFQWATYYRDTFSFFFEKILGSWIDSQDRGYYTQPDELVDIVGNHSEEVFQKGYEHVRHRREESHDFAIIKSLAGVQRFLDLPIELYSASLARGRSELHGTELRTLASCMLTGVLVGYTKAEYGDSAGSHLLPRYPRAWAHALPFLTSRDLTRLIDNIEAGPLTSGVRSSLAPVVGVIDALSREQPDKCPLPTLSQFIWNSRRLDVSLDVPAHARGPQSIDIHCYLDASFVQLAQLTEAARRGVSLIVAPLRSDVRQQATTNERLREILAEAGDPEDAVVLRRTRGNVRQVLNAASYARLSARFAAQPLRVNVARQFPLENPFLTRYVHVPRSSVRDLLRTFERRNGARLWCSIRRSGKTTACRDLGSATGAASVVIQTCASTGQLPGATILYESVVSHLQSGAQLEANFFADCIERCLNDGPQRSDRVILVLDEYERFFGHLRAAARRNEMVLYAVAHPLLDQMVAFMDSNLLVFLGQQPNAHFVLMEQNQLSAYVQQDPFPLFGHAVQDFESEFAELLRRVFARAVTFDGSFVDAVHAETSGHPYLTVNLLVHLTDWLIEESRPMSKLQLGAEDFQEFAEGRLTRNRIGRSGNYHFFREAIAEATSEDGRVHAPWLYAVYSVLREIDRESAGAGTCSYSDFRTLADTVGVEKLGMSVDDLLNSAAEANFFSVRNGVVAPQIPLLGRLAGVSEPRVTV